jgi:hypothetical protein
MSKDLTVTITGLDKVKRRGEELSGEVQKNVAKGIARFALRVKNTAVKLVLQGPKTGIRYGDHIASAPGEAPASDTGNLASHINSSVDTRELSGTVRAETPYAARLEFGDSAKTPGKPFIQPRPFLQPALEENAPAFLEEMYQAWREANER